MKIKTQFRKVTAKDVQVLLGVSQRTAYRKIKFARKKLDKQDHTHLTVEEFKEFYQLY